MSGSTNAVGTIQTFTGADQTLFHIAARTMGSADAWWRLAAANGVTDPWLTPGIYAFTIPAGPTPLTGGLPPQS